MKFMLDESESRAVSRMVVDGCVCDAAKESNVNQVNQIDG
jgi:hypothetical protein